MTESSDAFIEAIIKMKLDKISVSKEGKFYIVRLTNSKNKKFIHWSYPESRMKKEQADGN
jgi:hypothetical protein